MALTGCSTSKFVPEDRYLLDAVQVRTDSKELDAAQFGQYVRQKGNSHWFSLFKIPLGTYSLAGRDSTKWLNRTLRHIGEEPVVYDSLEAARSCADLRLAMTGTIRKFMAEHPDKFDPREYLKPARANIKELVRHKLVDVLGCAGKA